MTIGEAIQKLQEFETQVGPNVPIISLTEVDDRFAIDWDRSFDLIELPDANNNMDNPTLVCALMDEPDDADTEYPPLEVVRE